MIALGCQDTARFDSTAGAHCDPRHGHIPGAATFHSSGLLECRNAVVRRAEVGLGRVEVVAYCHSGDCAPPSRLRSSRVRCRRAQLPSWLVAQIVLGCQAGVALLRAGTRYTDCGPAVALSRASRPSTSQPTRERPSVGHRDPLRPRRHIAKRHFSMELDAPRRLRETERLRRDVAPCELRSTVGCLEYVVVPHWKTVTAEMDTPSTGSARPAGVRTTSLHPISGALAGPTRAPAARLASIWA